MVEFVRIATVPDTIKDIQQLHDNKAGFFVEGINADEALVIYKLADGELVLYATPPDGIDIVKFYVFDDGKVDCLATNADGIRELYKLVETP